MRVGSTFWDFSSHWWLQQKWLSLPSVPKPADYAHSAIRSGRPQRCSWEDCHRSHGQALGQSIIIENVSGAGGTIGSGRAAKAAPDGYTMVSGNLGSHGASYAYYPKLGYQPNSFSGVGMVAGTPNFIAVRKDLAFSNLSQFVTALQEHPDKFTAGHAGNGSNGNLVCLLFMATAGVKLQLVPYRGSGPAMNDLVGGQIDAMCNRLPQSFLKPKRNPLTCWRLHNPAGCRHFLSSQQQPNPVFLGLT